MERRENFVKKLSLAADTADIASSVDDKIYGEVVGIFRCHNLCNGASRASYDNCLTHLLSNADTSAFYVKLKI